MRVGLGLGLEAVSVFDSKSENMDRAVEAVRVRVRVGTWSKLEVKVIR